MRFLMDSGFLGGLEIDRGGLCRSGHSAFPSEIGRQRDATAAVAHEIARREKAGYGSFALVGNVEPAPWRIGS